MIRSRETELQLSDIVVAIFGNLPDGDKGPKLIKSIPLGMGSSIE